MTTPTNKRISETYGMAATKQSFMAVTMKPDLYAQAQAAAADRHPGNGMGA